MKSLMSETEADWERPPGGVRFGILALLLCRRWGLVQSVLGIPSRWRNRPGLTSIQR